MWGEEEKRAMYCMCIINLIVCFFGFGFVFVFVLVSSSTATSIKQISYSKNCRNIFSICELIGKHMEFQMKIWQLNYSGEWLKFFHVAIRNRRSKLNFSGKWKFVLCYPEIINSMKYFGARCKAQFI